MKRKETMTGKNGKKTRENEYENAEMVGEDAEEMREEENSSADKQEPGRKSRGEKAEKKKKKQKDDKDLMDLIQHKNEMLEKMREKIERQEEELKDKEDRTLRIVAEFDNYKKRICREQDLQQDKMYADILKELLPVLDDFDRALEMDIEEGNNFFQGIKLVYQSFRDILGRMGLSEIEAQGKEFNPRFHEAMGSIESEEKEGRVAYVVLKGYKYNDMVVRPARVMVSGGSNAEESDE